MQNNDILTIEEVAAYLRVSERTVYEWAQKGDIPCGKLGAAWRFKRSEIENWVDRRLSGKPRPVTVPTSVAIDSVLTQERTVILRHRNKTDILNELITVLASAPQMCDREQLAESIFRREAILSTAVGSGVAVPHVRMENVKKLVMVVGISREGITDYQTIDGVPVHVVCMIAAVPSRHEQYLRLLAAISGKLQDEQLRNELIAAQDAVAVYKILTGL